MKTTLNKIREHHPCLGRWVKLLKHLDKTEADDEPLDLLTILESNGLGDTLWCFRAIEGYDREMRLFGAWCARQVQHLMTDPRSIAAIDVAENFANGNASDEELADAWAGARDALDALDTSSDTAWAAEDAADAAWDAAWAAADSARDAAWDAAWAASDATRDAADAAARDALDALDALDTSSDASRGAAWATARDALAAAWTASDAARGAQEKHLREILKECGK